MVLSKCKRPFRIKECFRLQRLIYRAINAYFLLSYKVSSLVNRPTPLYRTASLRFIAINFIETPIIFI